MSSELNAVKDMLRTEIAQSAAYEKLVSEVEGLMAAVVIQICKNNNTDSFTVTQEAIDLYKTKIYAGVDVSSDGEGGIKFTLVEDEEEFNAKIDEALAGG